MSQRKTAKTADAPATGTELEAAKAAPEEPAEEQVLVVARFANTHAATQQYHELYDEQLDGKISIGGVVVVAADSNGKVHVEKLVEHSTRKGFTLGLVGALVAGAFFPATILAGGIALGVAGATAGKARNAAKRGAIDRELTDIIKPGTSGLVCLVDNSKAPRVKRKIRGAQEVRTILIDAQTAAALQAAKPVQD